jgi:hypothetical protein
MKTVFCFFSLFFIVSVALTVQAEPQSYRINYSAISCVEDPTATDSNGGHSIDYNTWGILNVWPLDEINIYCPLNYISILKADDVETDYHPGIVSGTKNCQVTVYYRDNHPTDQLRCRVYGADPVDADSNGYFDWDSTGYKYSAAGRELGNLAFDINAEIGTGDDDYMFLYCYIPVNNTSYPPSQIIGYQMFFWGY